MSRYLCGRHMHAERGGGVLDVMAAMWVMMCFVVADVVVGKVDVYGVI